MSSDSLPELLSAKNSSHLTQTSQALGLSVEQLDTLNKTSQSMKEAAYCPYSKFRVGAAILTTSGAIVKGCNVENASYPVGTCAERVAFGAAVAQGHLSTAGEAGAKVFKVLAVASDTNPPAGPCGMCRQFIREFCDLSMPIIMFGKDDVYLVKTLEELLPMSFGPEALAMPSAS